MLLSAKLVYAQSAHISCRMTGYLLSISHDGKLNNIRYLI